jgi:transcription antitermination factor NusG
MLKRNKNNANNNYISLIFSILKIEYKKMNYLKIKFLYICWHIMCWFAAKTKQKGEFKALNFFISMGINSYVPSYITKRVWSDRIKKVTVPAISGYVFFELPKIDFDLININPFTKNIVRDIDGLPAIIKDEEIVVLKKHLNGEAVSNSVKLQRGQKVKINSGPFMFKKGTIDKISCNKVIISIESININLVINTSSVVAA